MLTPIKEVPDEVRSCATVERIGEETPLVSRPSASLLHEEKVGQSYVFPEEERWFENIFVIAFVVYALSIGVAVCFYSSLYGWPITTSLLAATSTLLGPVYNVPAPDEDTLAGNAFTLLLFAWGQSIGVYCISTAVGQLVAQAPEIAARERRKLQEIPEDTDGDGEIGLWDYWAYWKGNMLVRMGYEDYTLGYFIGLGTLAWTGVGVAYGLFYEEWDFNTSLYFTMSTLTEMGLAVPSCYTEDGDVSTQDCTYGDFRGIFLSVYIMVGVPLFAVCVAQFAGVLIKRAVRKREVDILHTPLTEEEYQFAANFYGDDAVLSLGEFTVLELLRLQRVSIEDLEQIKELFRVIDETDTGTVDKPMLARRNLIHGYEGGSVSGASDDGAGGPAAPGLTQIASSNSSASASEFGGISELPNITPRPSGRQRSNSHTQTPRLTGPRSVGRPRSNSHGRGRQRASSGERGTLPFPLPAAYGSTPRNAGGLHSAASSDRGSSEDYVPLAIRRLSISEYNEVVVRHAIDLALPGEGGESSEEDEIVSTRSYSSRV
jgi:hypothetical protein